MKDKLRFDRFYKYDDLVYHLKRLANERPDLVTLEVIGQSFEGRDIWCAVATNSSTGPASEKPAFEIDGNIHASEVSASTACLYFLNKIIKEYDKNLDISRCLDTRAFYIIPRVNPDGAEAYLASPPKVLRSSTRPYPFDEEPVEGLKRQDVDGDGRMLSMRIPDSNGPWKSHPDDARLLIRRDPTETGGLYYRLLPEGVMENWDGVTVKIQGNKEKLDLNRNFPAHWRQEYEQQGAGPYPTSEPEIHALVDFIARHPNITGGVQFHTYTGVLLRPYGVQADEEMPAEDLWTFQAIGKKGTEITGYPNAASYHEFRYHPKEVITGTSDDWMYDHLGVFAWTVEIWSPQRQAGISEYKFIEWFREHPVEDDFKMLKWSDEKLKGKGYVDWYPFDHPQLGPVELGGWDVLYCFRNPPPEFLEKEVALFPDWLLWHAMISPRLELHSLEALPIGGGAYCVRLIVDNTGWLPTYVSKRALDRKVVRGVVAEIELPAGAELEGCLSRIEIGQLEGRAYTSVSPYGWGSDATDERGKAEWVVRAAAGQKIKVTARHDRAGVVRGEVALG